MRQVLGANSTGGSSERWKQRERQVMTSRQNVVLILYIDQGRLLLLTAKGCHGDILLIGLFGCRTTLDTSDRSQLCSPAFLYSSPPLGYLAPSTSS